MQLINIDTLSFCDAVDQIERGFREHFAVVDDY